MDKPMRRSTAVGFVVAAVLTTTVAVGLSIATAPGAGAAPSRAAPAHPHGVGQTSTLYVGESSTPSLGPAPQPGGIGVFDPTDLTSGPSTVLPAIPAPAGENGYASAVLVGTTLVGLDGGGQVLRRFNTLTGSSADLAITGPTAIGPVFALAASPDGATLYLVGVDNGALQVSAVSASTWTVTTTYDVPGSDGAVDSGVVTVDPETGDLWIAGDGDGVFVVDPSDWSTQTVLTGQNAGQVAINGRDAWIPSGADLVEIATGDLTTVRTVETQIGNRFTEAVASPGAPDVYATVDVLEVFGGHGIHQIALATVDATSGALSLGGGVGGGPFVPPQPPLAISADGSTVFVGVNSFDFSASGEPYTPIFGTIATFDTATDALTGDVSPTGPAVTALVPDPNPPIPGPTPIPTHPTQGYWQVASDGGVFSFGAAAFYGSMGGTPLNRPVVGIAAGPDDQGYWEVASDGGIFSFGSAAFFGSMGGHPLNAPIVGVAPTPDRRGYWEVASDGGIFSFGDAVFHGSQGGHPLNAPIVGIAATPDGGGYWEVAADGGIFAFGDAAFHGSAGATHRNAPVVGIAATPDGGGYWEVAADGGVFAFGDAAFHGSAGGTTLNRPVVGIAATPDGDGYWLVAADGGIFAYGDATFEGSMGGTPLNRPVVGIASTG
jgi:hypothetical protein